MEKGNGSARERLWQLSLDAKSDERINNLAEATKDFLKNSDYSTSLHTLSESHIYRPDDYERLLSDAYKRRFLNSSFFKNISSGEKADAVKSRINSSID